MSTFFRRRFALLFSLLLAVGLIVLLFPLEKLVFRMANTPAGPDGQNLAQALGYGKDARLLVVNSDDTAANPTFTDGIFGIMPLGMVTSTSVIVHDRNDEELKHVAEVAAQHPQWGIGIHLMLTNEYQDDYPWQPVLPRTQVPSLYNDAGLAWEKISEVEQFVKPEHAALEFKAQIQKALTAGIDLTHIDSHMGTYYRDSRFPGASRDGLRMAAIAAAEAFDLPITMNSFDAGAESSMRYLDRRHIIRPDTFFGFYELEDMNVNLGYQGSSIRKWLVAWVAKRLFGFELPYANQSGLAADMPQRLALYQQALLGVTRPGLNHIFIHAAVEHGRDGSTIPRGKNHAAGVDKVVRLSDAAVWSSDAMQAFLAEQDMHLVNYTEIRAVQRRWRQMPD